MTVTITYDGATPTVGADADTWGAELNTGALAKIKVDLDALAAQGNAEETEQTATIARVDALEAADLKMAHTGDIKFGLYSTAPSGWVKADGGTVGNTSSGATRANADTAALFSLLWNLNATDSPILTSAGAGSTRGANATADFVANKRLTLPDFRAYFIRGLDDGRGVDAGRRLGSSALDTFESHNHLVSPPTASGEAGQGGTTTGTLGGGETVTPYSSGSTGSTETAPKNIAALAVIKL